MTAIVMRTPAAPPTLPPGGRFSVSGPSIKCKAPACVAIDYETEAIDRRPAYPPRPVGVAIDNKYWAWGHPTENNCTERQALDALAQAWASGLPILCQHGKFDLDIAETHQGLPPLPWERTLDTEYLLFLHDPHAKSLALKESAQRVLGIAPEERDELKEWVMANVPEAKKKPSEWGSYICKAPGKLVGRYAVGDNRRARALHNELHPRIYAQGMGAAYERERKLMQIWLEAERVGIRTDYSAMERDLPLFQAARERVGDWLRKRLKRPGLNLDSDQQVGDALWEEQIVVDWTWTKGSKDGKRPPQRSVSKKNMTLDKFTDQKVAMAYGYYQRCGTLLSFFLEKWLALAGPNGGWLKPNWNSVRQDRNGGLVGARSGRPSCDDPNFLAIVKKWENNKGDGYTHPKFLSGLPELSLVRKYLLPDENCYWLKRDYNQQELRMLGHFEGGELAAMYSQRPYRNPDGSMRFDIHTTVQQFILEVAGLDLNRDHTKIVNFSDVYGKGLTGLAEELGVDRGTASRIRAAKARLLPGVEALKAAIDRWGRAGQPIVTWGGRLYYAEPPSYSDKYNRVMDYYYKLLNYQIQPSSADVTKEALIRYASHPKREGRFLVQVYDEVNIGTPSLKGLSKRAKDDCIAREMAVLRDCMETIETSVPMLSDGEVGPNWGTLTKYWNKQEAKEIV